MACAAEARQPHQCDIIPIWSCVLHDHRPICGGARRAGPHVLHGLPERARAHAPAPALGSRPEADARASRSAQVPDLPRLDAATRDVVRRELRQPLLPAGSCF